MAECAICQDVLLGEDPSQAMTCGHTFHAGCLETYASIAGVSMHQLRCPSCRKSAADMAGAEAQLVAAFQPRASTNGPIEQINLDNDAPVFEQVICFNCLSTAI